MNDNLKHFLVLGPMADTLRAMRDTVNAQHKAAMKFVGLCGATNYAVDNFGNVSAMLFDEPPTDWRKKPYTERSSRLYVPKKASKHYAAFTALPKPTWNVYELRSVVGVSPFAPCAAQWLGDVPIVSVENGEALLAKTAAMEIPASDVMRINEGLGLGPESAAKWAVFSAPVAVTP